MALENPSVPLDLVLANRRVINVTGPDALSFLQAQLTADVTQVPQHEWRMAGYCSAKGRLLASGLLWHIEGGFAWLVADDLAAALVKRLRMFVLRAKVSIEIREAAVIGRIGSAVPAPHVQAQSQHHDEGISFWLGLPDVLGRPRAFGVLESEHLDAFLARVSSQQAGATDARATWDWLEVRSGFSFIESATQDRFVPQMVNLEALGGVDFKKGCYPGQEVVARSQYLGKLKRRTLLAHSQALDQETLPTPGGDVYDLDSHEPVGTIVSAARAPDGSVDCLIEAPLAAWPNGLALSGQSVAPLEPLDLPYVLPDNEVFVRPRL
jgi:folate-binding protein YgfZ